MDQVKVIVDNYCLNCITAPRSTIALGYYIFIWLVNDNEH